MSGPSEHPSCVHAILHIYVASSQCKARQISRVDSQYVTTSIIFIRCVLHCVVLCCVVLCCVELSMCCVVLCCVPSLGFLFHLPLLFVRSIALALLFVCIGYHSFTCGLVTHLKSDFVLFIFDDADFFFLEFPFPFFSLSDVNIYLPLFSRYPGK
jgi:hypothetical protein